VVVPEEEEEEEEASFRFLTLLRVEEAAVLLCRVELRVEEEGELSWEEDVESSSGNSCRLRALLLGLYARQAEDKQPRR
jgi:hypothetical protein